MNSDHPQSIRLVPEDAAFLEKVADAILGRADVAATTAEKLRALGFDPQRIDTLIPKTSRAVAIDGVVLKKVEPDPESPGNYGLFVRRRPASGAAGAGRPPS